MYPILHDIKGILEILGPLLAANVVGYYILTTDIQRRRHHRQFRAAFYIAHRSSYLQTAKKGSASFLEFLNKVFGVVSNPDHFFSSSYFSKRMIVATFIISYSYVCASIIYFDYIANEYFVVQDVLADHVNRFPLVSARPLILNAKWTHIFLGLIALWPIVLMSAIAIFVARIRKAGWLSITMYLLFAFFSYQWIQDTKNIAVRADFESPIYVAMQFVVHGSARYESLLGDIYIVIFLGTSCVMLGIWWGTVSSLVTFLLVSFRKVAYFGIQEGFSSLNFAFWFNRVVASISRVSIFLLMPFVNFLADCASINISRYLFHRLKGITRWGSFIAIVLYDVLFAIIAFLATPILFLMVTYVVDFINVWEFGTKKLTPLLLDEMRDFVTGKADARTWWVWVMFLSTVLPSIFHLLFVAWEMSVKLVEPAARYVFFKGHYLLRERPHSEETPIVQFKIGGQAKVALIIALYFVLVEVGLIYLSRLFFAAT